MRRTKEVRPWVDKLIDNSSGRAGLPGVSRVILGKETLGPHSLTWVTITQPEAGHSKWPVLCWGPQGDCCVRILGAEEALSPRGMG